MNDEDGKQTWCVYTTKGENVFRRFNLFLQVRLHELYNKNLRLQSWTMHIANKYDMSLSLKKKKVLRRFNLFCRPIWKICSIHPSTR